MEKKGRERVVKRMRLEGWFFLVIVWGLILFTAAYCFKRIFEKKNLK